MKKISDLKDFNATEDVVVSTQVQNFMDKVLMIAKELNNNSVNQKNYTVDFKPIISGDKIEDVEFTLKQNEKNSFLSVAEEQKTAKAIFSLSTLQSFYAFEGVAGYETSNRLSEHNYRQVEEVKFKGGFYYTHDQYVEIVENFMVEAFLKNEKDASQESKFNRLVKQKKSSMK